MLIVEWIQLKKACHARRGKADGRISFAEVCADRKQRLLGSFWPGADAHAVQLAAFGRRSPRP